MNAPPGLPTCSCVYADVSTLAHVSVAQVSRRILDRFLRKLGHGATVLASGEQALATLTAADATGAPFDAVLLDVMMAGQDGKQVCKLLRNAGATVPIIATTGTTDVVALRDLVTVSGFTTVLPKPFTIGDLGDCLHDTVSVITDGESLEFTRNRESGDSVPGAADLARVHSRNSFNAAGSATRSPASGAGALPAAIAVRSGSDHGAPPARAYHRRGDRNVT